MSADKAREPIVSSAHLAEQGAELSELEFGLIVAGNAFQRWVTRCMAAAGVPDLAHLDVLVLHTVNHRARDKRLADICFVLNIDDQHLVSYALKKLEKLGLVERARKGKEVLYASSEAGRAACTRYREVRERCLIEALAVTNNRELSEAARLLRALSGLYDQAARAATSL